MARDKGSGMNPGNAKYWRKLTAQDYAELFPAEPKPLRKIAYALRKLGAQGIDDSGDGSGNEVFTLYEWDLAARCGVKLRTWQRYVGVFESYGILEVKRWRHRKYGGSPSSYRVFLGNVIPKGGHKVPGPYPISAVERRITTS